MADPAANAILRTHIHCVGATPAGVTRRRVWELPTGHDCMITMRAELLLTIEIRAEVGP